MLEPLKKAMGSTIEVQPEIATPSSLLVTTKTPTKIEIIKLTTPNHSTIRMGTIEKEVMPFQAKPSIFIKGYLLSPASRSNRL